MDFTYAVTAAARRNASLVCVGLDTDPAKLPHHLRGLPDGVLRFNRAIVKATADLVCCYKPNAAFYEALGSRGIDQLIATRESIPKDIPVILDVKRGDISSTAERYAAFCYDIVGADAVTVNPYMGFDAVQPFLRDDRCVFILCLTSNPSASDFQMLSTPEGPFYMQVAKAAAKWTAHGGIGLVVGATRPGMMREIRSILGNHPILVPGVGTQGGDAAAVLSECGAKPGLTIVNVSRAVLYASSGEDFAEAARTKLIEFRSTLSPQVSS